MRILWCGLAALALAAVAARGGEPAANTWTKLAAAKANGPHKLVPRGWTSLRYEPGSKRLIWFVADETEQRIYSNCLWFYDPDKNEWTSEANPYPIPAPEGTKAMVYRDDHPMTRHPYRGNEVDPENKVFVQFGGVGYGQWQSDTWAYDLAKGAWKDLKPAAHPPCAGMSAMAYVPELKGILSHGGQAGGNDLPETWLFDVKAGAWRNLKSANTPRGGDHDLVYDPKSRTCVTFLAGKTWVYEVAANAWKTADGPGPVPRAHYALAGDGDQGLVVLFAGRDENSQDPRAKVQTEPKWGAPQKGTFTDTWLFDTAARTWHDLGKEKDLDPDKCADRPNALAWDPSRKLVFGVGTGAAVWTFKPQLSGK
jgi:hypothetical protein